MGYVDFWFPDRPLIPQLSFGEIMDKLFSLWIADGTDSTFDEFLESHA